MSEAEGSAAWPAPAEHTLEVPRTARYYTVGTWPASTLWVGLHGYGQLAAYFARHFAAHAAGRLVVVPEGLSRFYVPSSNGAPGGANPSARVGATWMTREDRLNEIGDYVRYLDRTLDVVIEAAPVDLARTPLAVLGFSQGAATACRWAAHRHTHGLAPATRVVLWGGTIPHDFTLDGADGDALRTARLTLVVGATDPFATAAVIGAEEARLRAAGIGYELVRYPGGHRIHDATLGRVLDG